MKKRSVQGTEGQSYNITAHGIADHGHTNRQSAGPFPLFSHRGDSVDSSRAQVILSFDKWPASSEMTMTSRDSLRPMSGNSPAVSLSVSQVVRNATQLHLCHLFFLDDQPAIRIWCFVDWNTRRFFVLRLNRAPSRKHRSATTSTYQSQLVHKSECKNSRAKVAAGTQHAAVLQASLM